MKRIALIALCLAVVCALAACVNTEGTSEPEPSDAGQIVESAEEPVAVIEDVSDDLDYDSIIRDLGSLMTGPDWAKTEDIPVGNLVMWYCYSIRDANAVDREYMSEYLAEGKEGFHIPASEFEAAIKKTFGLSAEHLRAGSELYNEETDTFTSPALALDFVKTEFTITEARMNGTAETIIFELAVDGAPAISRALTVEKDENGVRFSSYTNGDGTIADNPASTKASDAGDIPADADADTAEADDRSNNPENAAK